MHFTSLLCWFPCLLIWHSFVQKWCYALSSIHLKLCYILLSIHLSCLLWTHLSWTCAAAPQSDTLTAVPSSMFFWKLSMKRLLRRTRPTRCLQESSRNGLTLMSVPFMSQVYCTSSEYEESHKAPFALSPNEHPSVSLQGECKWPLSSRVQTPGTSHLGFVLMGGGHVFHLNHWLSKSLLFAFCQHLL